MLDSLVESRFVVWSGYHRVVTHLFHVVERLDDVFCGVWIAFVSFLHCIAFSVQTHSAIRLHSKLDGSLFAGRDILFTKICIFFLVYTVGSSLTALSNSTT